MSPVPELACLSVRLRAHHADTNSLAYFLQTPAMPSAVGAIDIVVPTHRLVCVHKLQASSGRTQLSDGHVHVRD